MEKIKATIAQVTRLSRELFEYRLVPARALSWIPGTHLHVGLPGFDADEKPNKELVHHLSVVSIPDDQQVVVVTRIPEDSDRRSLFKQTLAQLSAGDQVTLFKFANVLYLEDDTRMIFVTQGVGLAPAVPLMRINKGWPHPGCEVRSLHISKAGDHIYQAEVESYVGADHAFWTESREALAQRLIKEIEQAAADGVRAVYLPIGSKAFLQTQIELLRAQGVQDECILLDKKASKREDFGLKPLPESV